MKKDRDETQLNWEAKLLKHIIFDEQETNIEWKDD